MLPVFFANPAGWWALLGIPALLLIHLLQRRSTVLPASTLFLLDAIDRSSAGGTRLERLRHSLPLWLQILAVVLLAWLLAEPRRAGDRSVYPVVAVLDGSASMDAFREQAGEALARELGRLSPRFGSALHTVLESQEPGVRAYRGSSLVELRESLAAWRPTAGSHSPEAALRVGRSLAGGKGTLLFVTDRIPSAPLPYAAYLLSVGEAIDNVGFSGHRVEVEGADGPVWRAMVRNHSQTPQEREWRLSAGGQRSPARRLALAPGETRTLSGPFPSGAETIVLELEPDRFALDDRLHLVVPRPKPLLAGKRVSDEAIPLVRDLVATLEGVDLAEGGGESAPDFFFATYNPLSPVAPPSEGLLILSQRSAPREFLRGSITAANHPLVEGLNWQGLIARQTPGIPLQERDQALLWQGERPLALLRESPEGRLLIFNFDVVQSNASRLPAFIVLAHRFVESLREGKIEEHADNLELRQRLSVAHERGDEAPPLVLATSAIERAVPLDEAGILRAPAEPGFFEVRQGGRRLFLGSANFADAREADFREAASYADLAEAPAEIAERLSVEDASWRYLVLALLLLSLGIWAAVARESRLRDDAREQDGGSGRKAKIPLL